MFRSFLLIFLLILIVEIVLFIQVGGHIGAGNTIIAIFATGIIGVMLVRREGIRTLATMQAKMAQGQTPGRELAEGVLLLLAGLFLLLPGFFTDVLGFLQIIPVVRAFIVKIVLGLAGHGAFTNVHNSSRTHQQTDHSFSQNGFGHSTNPFDSATQSSTKKAQPLNSKPVVLEGEYRHESEDDKDKTRL
ncbi:MAG: FxsA family protein [Magnetococcales bacterium]|nr:FxsA family protein [Magnetococcales bacterium]